MHEEDVLNDLIGSRICHDLISPLGAIGNGVELLSLTSTGVVPEIALISESIQNANARIRFFRIAFGAASQGAMVGDRELRDILSDMYRGSRLLVDWRVTTELPRGEAKLAFLLLQCLEAALPWGGDVTITRSHNTRWKLDGTSERLKIEPPLWELLSEPQPNPRVAASEVQFALVQGVARRLQRAVTTELGEDRIAISF